MNKIKQFITNMFKGDFQNYGGVPSINIYLLRLLFTLMFIFVSYDSWTYILNHTAPWDHVKAAAWCMWGSYPIISFIGIMRPLKMLPIVLFEIVYKVTWLMIVAYPLWVKNELMGSSAEAMTQAFIWVVLPIAAMPWGYFFKAYIWGRKTPSFIGLISAMKIN